MLTKQSCSALAQGILQGSLIMFMLTCDQTMLPQRSLYKAYLRKMLNDLLQRSLDMLPLTYGQTMLLNRNPWKLDQTQLFSNCSKDPAQKLHKSSCKLYQCKLASNCSGAPAEEPMKTIPTAEQ